MPAGPRSSCAVYVAPLAPAAGRVRMYRGQPLRLGVPLPREWLSDPRQVRLRDAAGREVPLQATPVDLWSDTSVRWLLLDFQVTLAGERGTYQLERGCSIQPPLPSLARERADGTVEIDTGPASFEARSGREFPLTAGPAAMALEIEDEDGHRLDATFTSVAIEENGPLRATVRADGRIGGRRQRALLELALLVHFYRGSTVALFELTTRNPRRASHPGGYWELGGGGSVLLRELTVSIRLPAGEARARCSPETGAPFADLTAPMELYQDSSGGSNWQSRNHVSRHGRTTVAFRGYRFRVAGRQGRGWRATPIVSAWSGRAHVSIAMRQFWQNFPKCLAWERDCLRLSLFPRQAADLHEIQGGEQKTHAFFIGFGADAITDEPLDWVRSPLCAWVDPAWACATGAFGSVLPLAEDAREDCVRLARAAIEGPTAFAARREVVDEYGWRHFGDLYADHESVHAPAERPLISHYNNQYDAVAGFACQHLRDGDLRWRELMDDLAAHVVDVDIYHTGEDRSEYSHGLFWHTAHYVDAGRSTHRTYARSSAAGGGGPSAEHNYTTGLMLHWFMTGSRRSRDAVLELAGWVLQMEEGGRAILRWIARPPSGAATRTVSPLYHGPGRGAGNSINAMLDAFRLTGEARYLEAAERFIRRCIHPRDDIAARALLDAERRWSYTVFLQALGKYLDIKRERGERDRMYRYARCSLLAYADWMAAHERAYLDHPEALEFPTETWAAQELRKADVFRLAAAYGTSERRPVYVERSEYFYDRAIGGLRNAPTRTLTRPLVLLITNTVAPPARLTVPADASPDPVEDFGHPAPFVSQRQRAARRLASAAALIMAATLLLLLAAL